MTMNQTTDTEDSDPEYRWSAHVHFGALRRAAHAVAGVANSTVALRATADGLVLFSPGTSNPPAAARATIRAGSGVVWDHAPPDELAETTIYDAGDLAETLTWFAEGGRLHPDAVTLVGQYTRVNDHRVRPEIHLTASADIYGGGDAAFEATIQGSERGPIGEPPDSIGGHSTTLAVEGEWLADAVAWCAGPPPDGGGDHRRVALEYHPDGGGPAGPRGEFVVRRADDRPDRSVHRVRSSLGDVAAGDAAVASVYQAEYLQPAIEALPGGRIEVALGEHWPLVATYPDGDRDDIEVAVAPWGEDAIERLDGDGEADAEADDGE